MNIITTREILNPLNFSNQTIWTPRFRDFIGNNFSQCGEDGVLHEIFKRIDCSKKFYVEFGAWDGVFCSNTKNLRDNFQWQGALFEGSLDKVNSVSDKDAINLNCEFITQDTAVDIFRKYKVPDSFGLLSIDIDSDDGYVWEALCEEYEPLVAVIEYNTGLPNHVPISAKPNLSRSPENNPGAYFNCNLNRLLSISEKAGYKFVDILDQNVIFCHPSVFDRLKIENLSKADVIGSFGKTQVTDFWKRKISETNDEWILL